MVFCVGELRRTKVKEAAYLDELQYWKTRKSVRSFHAMIRSDMGDSSHFQNVGLNAMAAAET